MAAAGFGYKCICCGVAVALPVGSATKTLFPVQKLLITNSWFDLSSLNSHEEYASRLADLICVSIPAGSQLQSDNSRDSNDVVEAV